MLNKYLNSIGQHGVMDGAHKPNRSLMNTSPQYKKKLIKKVRVLSKKWLNLTEYQITPTFVPNDDDR